MSDTCSPSSSSESTNPPQVTPVLLNEAPQGASRQEKSSSKSNQGSIYITANSSSHLNSEISYRRDSNATSELPSQSTTHPASQYVTARSNYSFFSNQQGLAASAQPSTNESVDYRVKPLCDQNEEAYDNLHELPDSVHLDQLLHTPPYVPNPPIHSTLGRPSLRQTIISRQSSRLLPTSDRLLDYMEEQIVRWRAPGSSFRADDILSGKHPFQQSSLPNHETSNDINLQYPSAAIIETTGNNSTDSMVNSIAKSPFVNPEQSTIQRNDRLRATFREYNGSTSVKETEDTNLNVEEEETEYDDNCSIQESLNFHTTMQPVSGSVSSSMMLNLREMNNGTGAHTPKLTPDVVTSSSQTAQTVEAQPLDNSDVELLVKNQPEHIFTQIIFNQQETENAFNSHYLQDENSELSCWSATVEAWFEIWLECVNCFTCNFEPADPYRIYEQ